MGTAIIISPSLQSLVRDGSPWLIRLVNEIEGANKEFAAEVAGLNEQVEQVDIEAQDSYEVMAILASELASLDKRIIGYHEPFKKGSDALHKLMVGLEKQVRGPLQLGSGQAKRKIIAWDTEQRRILAQQQQAARDAATQQARDLQLAAAAETERAGGSEAEVAAVLSAPVNLPAPRVAPTYQAASNLATSTRWHAEITSIKELCAAIGSGAQPELLAVGITEYEKDGATWLSSPTLNKHATAMTTTMNIPGVKAVPETGVSVRTS